MEKIFIVGCPRSGTTLLQSFMASHSQIVSFPETHLYSSTISINPILQALTLYRKKHLNQVEDILSEFEVPINDEFNSFGYTISTGKWVEFLNGQLDQIGRHYRQSNETHLLEKTPRHLHFIDLISDTDNHATFIHLIRNGEDVVASMSEATGDNPDEWSGERSIDKSIFWWNRSIGISKRYLDSPNNYFIRYENLVAEPEKVLKYIFEKIGIPFEAQVLENYHKTANSLIGEEEVWKDKNTKETLHTSDKFDKLSDQTKRHIKQNLSQFDYSKIDISNLV